MRRRWVLVTTAVTALACSAAALPLSLAGPAAYRDSAAARSRIVFASGTTPGTFRIAPRPRIPLALLSIEAGNGERYTVVRSGTDFSDPTVWLRMHAGTLCWAERPMVSARSYAVRNPSVPFRAPRADWTWSTIVLLGRNGPLAFAAPTSGQVLSAGERVRRVVLCVDPVSATRSVTSKPNDKITICHATNSTANPYSRMTVDASSITDDNGHGSHTGPLYPEPGWGDVIPPFDGYPGLNWPAGAGLLEDGCDVPEPPDPDVPPDTDVEPPEPGVPMLPIYLPIEVTPPIYYPDPSPTATPTATPTTPPSSTPTDSPQPVVTASPSTVVGPPDPGTIRFHLTDGRHHFFVERPAVKLAHLAQPGKPDTCLPTSSRGEGQTRGC